MELTVIGSSSSGNGYVLRASGGEAVIIECGMPLQLVKKAVGYRVSDIKGIIVTHEHGDHAGRCREYLDDLTAPMFMSAGTWEAISGRCKARRKPDKASHLCEIRCGGFRIAPLLLESANGNLTHDAAEPMCYYIDHEEMGSLLFVTDSYCLPYRIKGLYHLVIECNYDSDILEERYEQGLIDPKRRARTIESHLSYQNCLHELGDIDLKDVLNIVLVHISADNGNVARFVGGVGMLTHKRVFAASEGLKFKLNKEPF